jgi:hypothetical protein
MRTFFRLVGGVVVATSMAVMVATTGGQALAATGAAAPASTTGSNILTSVAVASGSNAWAVGWVASGNAAHTVVERWNGNAWKLVPSPSPGGTTGQSSLYGVAVRSSTAWAVGQYWNGKAFQTLTEHWNGTAWRRVPSPNPGGSARTNYLTHVAYISRSQAWAVGWYKVGTTIKSLILHLERPLMEARREPGSEWLCQLQRARRRDRDVLVPCLGGRELLARHRHLLDFDPALERQALEAGPKPEPEPDE